MSGGIAQIAQFLANPHGIVPDLGYPMYFFAILGVWKVLGAIAILVPRFPRLKEWAYAGIFFDLTGAAASCAAVGGYGVYFEFSNAGEEVVDGHHLTKVAFQHIRGTRSPAALALRGREYPLELSGTAWIDAETSAIARISASVRDTMVDVGLNTLQTDVVFAPFPFKDLDKTYWFPQRAVVEVETPRQHWRNTHEFTNYKRFSVSTEEQVAKK